MNFRRFELIEKDPARIEELEAILNRAGLSRYELALIVTALRVRPEYRLDDFRT
jgi:hypothetical protein